jgi:hypothetical protein
MRTRYIYFSFLFLTCIACNKDNFNYPPDTVGISKIIYFPTISIKGDKYIIFQQNAPFVDPGATATLTGKDISFTVTPSTINTAVPGVYQLTYSAVNAQGFAATDTRTVVVVPTSVSLDAIVAANDFSGTYLRAATGVTSTWTKIGNGVYIVENPGGAGIGAGYQVVGVNYSGNTISIPVQFSASYGGNISADNATYSNGNPAMYAWVFHATNYGTSLRTFVKQ